MKKVNSLRYKITGWLLSLFFQKQSGSAGGGNPEHIVFLRPGKLGDMLVATPLFHALKSELPHIHVSVICSKYNHIIIKNCPDIHNVKVVNFNSLSELASLLGWIKKNRVDMVIDLTPGISRTSTILSCFLRMAGIKTAGMHKSEFSRFFDVNIDPHGMHIIERNRVLLETVLQYQFKNLDFHPLIYSTERQASAAADFIQMVGKEKITIGVNLSAGRRERQWRYENYSNLAFLIHEHYSESVRVILFAHGEQKQWAEKISRETGFHVAPSSDIQTIAEILRFCRFLFTPDTAFLHLASAVKIPVVALYCTAGENLIRWRTYGVETRELVACFAEDVNEIPVQRAFDEIKGMLGMGEGCTEQKNLSARNVG